MTALDPLDTQHIWRQYWHLRELQLGHSVEALMHRGFVARGVEWALRGHDVAAFKILDSQRRVVSP